MYGYLPGFCIRVFLVRVLSHLTICSAFSFLLHSCASGQSFSMRGERVPHRLEHGVSLCLITELHMQLAWKEEKSLKNYWSGVCAGVTCFPLRASSQGQVDIQDCSLVGWYWLQGAAPICFQVCRMEAITCLHTIFLCLQ